MGSKYLLREVREAGGAYGAGAQQAGDAFRFFSYRDPAGLRTLSKYSGAVEWLLEGDGWGTRDVNEAILKVFQGVDAPKSARTRGVAEWRAGVTAAELAVHRAQLLAMTSSDVKNVCEKYLLEPIQYSDCIIGPLEALIEQRNNPSGEMASELGGDGKWRTYTL